MYVTLEQAGTYLRVQFQPDYLLARLFPDRAPLGQLIALELLHMFVQRLDQHPPEPIAAIRLVHC
jgi:hypothetical protein